MISAYNTSEQTVVENGNLLFSTNRILTGCTVTHEPGTATFSLNRPGYYFVSFMGDAAATAADPGVIAVQLLSNTTEVPGALSSSNSTGAADTQSLSFSTIVRVTPTCCPMTTPVTLTLQNTGVEAVFSNVNFTVTKLC